MLGKLRGGDLFFLHPGGEGKGDEEAHISVEVHTRRNHKNHFFLTDIEISFYSYKLLP